MTLKLRVDGDYSGRGLPNTKPFLPGFEASLYAAYLLGTGYGQPLGSDASGANRTADVTGLPTGNRAASNVTLGADAKIVYPFTSAQIGTRTGKATIVSVSKIPLTGDAFLAGGVFSTEPWIALVANTSNNGKAFLRDSTLLNQALLDNTAPDATRANRYEMFAGVFAGGTSVRVARKHSGVAIQSSSTATALPIAGTRLLTSGVSPQNNGYPGPFNSSGVLFFDDALSDADLETLFPLLTAKMTPLGVTF